MTREKARLLALLGVDRLSIGVQTLNPGILKRINREQKTEDIRNVISWAREYGIPTMNTDLIAGLEGESLLSFRRTVEKIIGMKPDSLRYANSIQQGRLSFQGEENPFPGMIIRGYH
jgi:oxygen-independent coproporphyrinogen-3 oxidase